MAPSPHQSGPGAFAGKTSGASASAAPGTIIAAAWLLVMAAVAQVVASILGLRHALSPERAVVLQSQLESGESSLSLEALRNVGVLTVVIAGICTVLAYLLFAFFLTKGRSWARTATAVLLTLTLSQLVGIVFPGGYTTISQLLLGAVAVVFCYRPLSKKYFADTLALRS